MKEQHQHNGVLDHRFRVFAGGMWICIFLAGAGLVTGGAMLWARRQRPALNVPPERINPNSAPAASLVRLPNIGKARALDVVAYRQQVEESQTPFRTAHDLENIRGIGPKTVEAMEPWLTFETELSDTD